MSSPQSPLSDLGGAVDIMADINYFCKGYMASPLHMGELKVILSMFETQFLCSTLNSGHFTLIATVETCNYILYKL
jgi:hypothetical protein